MDALNYKNFDKLNYRNLSTPTVMATSDNSGCKSPVLRIAPTFDSKTKEVTDFNRICLRTKYKIGAKVGDKIIFHHPNYGTKKYSVVGKWEPDDRDGGCIFIQEKYVDVGVTNTGGIPTDRTKDGWVSLCPQDLSNFATGSLFSDDEKEKSGSKKSPLMIIGIVVFAVIILILVFVSMRNKKNKNK